MLLCRGPRTVVPVPGSWVAWGGDDDDPLGSCLSWLLGRLQPPREELGVVVYCRCGEGGGGSVHILSVSHTATGVLACGGGQFTLLALSCAEEHSVTPETLSDLRLCVFSILNEGWCF